MLKYKIYVLLLFILSIISISIVNANNSLELIDKVIYLDPGHGGADSGARYKDIKESQINLEIALKLKKELENNGATVYLTRLKDIDLSEGNSFIKRSDINNRIRLINEKEPDLYLSIHLNSTLSPTWYGAQIFYDDINEKNKEIASVIQEELIKKTNTKRSVKEINNILLNRKILYPGVLLELGFISNVVDRNNLINDNYQTKLSKIITTSIIKYFTSNK